MRILFIILFVLGLLLNYTNIAEASLLTLESGGKLRVNVLSAEDDIALSTPEKSDLKIDRVTDGKIGDASIVKLNSSKGQINLEVFGSSGFNTLNVTNFKENVIEIEERPAVQKLEISIFNGKFRVKNRGVSALTSYPITVDSKTAQVSIKTDTGDRNLEIFPYEAVQSALRTKFITHANGGVEIIVEGDDLQYKITGERRFNLFDLYNYSVPISSYISGVTGEVIKIDAPGWLKIINVIFT